MLIVSIPDELDQQQSDITNDKNKFIIPAIKQKISLRKKPLPDEELAKEYTDSIEENEQITKAFYSS